ncbi:YccF domain-containing protein [Actinoplanes sp. TBRC 11911]|nr:YccF domain-containing protein [Actinoplanes sp. TBRC 11911]
MAWRRQTVGVRFILNVLWFIFGSGLLLAIGYGLAALLCFVLIVTIPFGVAALRIAGYALWPFGRTVVSRPSAGVASGIANVLWVVLAGWWIALGHIVTGVAQCVTIIGIPFGIANFKLVPVAFWPLGRQIVDVDNPRVEEQSWR